MFKYLCVIFVLIVFEITCTFQFVVKEDIGKMDTLCVPSPVYGRRTTTRPSIDVQSGEIFIRILNEGKPIRHRMHMKVFRNGYEHHAQLYTDSNYTFSYGFISLRKCTVNKNDNSKIVSISGGNVRFCRAVDAVSNSFSFEAKSQNEAKEWLKSLTPSKHLCYGSEFSPCPSPLFQRKY